MVELIYERPDSRFLVATLLGMTAIIAKAKAPGLLTETNVSAPWATRDLIAARFSQDADEPTLKNKAWARAQTKKSRSRTDPQPLVGAFQM